MKHDFVRFHLVLLAATSLVVLGGCTTTTFFKADFENYAEGERLTGEPDLRGAPGGDSFMYFGAPEKVFVTSRTAPTGKHLEFRATRADEGPIIGFHPARSRLPEGNYVYNFAITGTGDLTAFTRTNEVLIRIVGTAQSGTPRRLLVNERELAQAPDGEPFNVLLVINPEARAATVLARGRTIEVPLSSLPELPSELWFRNDEGIFFIDNVHGFVATRER